MNLLIQLPLPVLRSFVNQAFETMIAQSSKDADVMGLAGVEIRPQGEIQLWGEGKEIMFSAVSIEVMAKIRTDGLPIPPLIRSLSPWEKIRCSLRVSLRTQLFLQDDWHLEANSQVDYEWIQKPSLGVGLVQVPVARMVNPFLIPQLGRVAGQVDALIRKVPILWAVQKSWKELHTFHLVVPEKEVWLQLPLSEPMVGVSPLRVEKTAIELGIQLPIHAQVKLGASPEKNPLLDLAQWQPWGPFVAQSSLPLTADIPWDYLMKMLQQEPFVMDEGKHRLNVHVREIRASGEIVQAMVAVDGQLGLGRISPKVKGDILLQGRFAIHDNKQEVIVETLSFRVRKGGPLMRSIGLLFRKRLSQQIIYVGNRLLRALIRDIFRMTQKAVRTVELDRGFHLRTEVEAYEFQAIRILEAGIQADILAKGSSRLDIEEIPL